MHVIIACERVAGTYKMLNGNRPRIDMKPPIWMDSITNETISGSL